MPELPEVETVRRGLKDYILNKKIVQVKVDCEKSFVGGAEMAQAAEGATVTDIRRRGKALLIDLDNGCTLMIHLRMTGQLIWRGLLSERITSSDSPVRGGSTLSTASLRASNLPRTSSPIASPHVASSPKSVPHMTPSPIASLSVSLVQSDAAHASFAAGHPSKNFTDKLPNAQTRVTFVFEEGKLFFNDQRKFGFVKILPTDEVELDKFIAELAKEPWGMTAGELFQKCKRHGKSPIKAVLLNQKLIAGLGNIYADESLFYASVHPAELAGNLTEGQVAKILEGACRVMDASIESGGSTMATYVRPDGSTGDYLEKFAQVFRREGKECYRCGAEIVKTRCAGRGTHYCPNCQGLLSGRIAASESAVRGSRTLSPASLRSSTHPCTSSQLTSPHKAGDKMPVEGAERA